VYVDTPFLVRFVVICLQHPISALKQTTGNSCYVCGFCGADFNRVVHRLHFCARMYYRAICLLLEFTKDVGHAEERVLTQTPRAD